VVIQNYCSAYAAFGAGLRATTVTGSIANGDKVDLTGVASNNYENLTKYSCHYYNPVIDHDAPDPGVLRVGKEWWMATTGGDPSVGAFPMYRSRDLVHWHPFGNIFEAGEAPTWSDNSYWAPEIHKVGDKFVAYFTARDHNGMLCIGAAEADKVEGPYKDLGAPLVADPDMGLIDPTFFQDDDGKQYLYWKEDGNAFNPPLPTRILAQELGPDGMSLVGEPRELIRNDLEWEGDIVEAPEVEKRGEYYYLFYSGNGFWGDMYAEGVARSKSPLGPFEKAPEPFLRSNEHWKGPGHAAITQDNEGQDWIVYHAWDKDHIGQHPGRMVLIDPLKWDEEEWPYVDGPSTGGDCPEGTRKCTGVAVPRVAPMPVSTQTFLLSPDVEFLLASA
jgi:arabinan endo-1,5-alpha-L-arabinosidase